LELKQISIVEKERLLYTINTKMKNWYLVDVDILGNIYIGDKI
jgi:hypothetical protein